MKSKQVILALVSFIIVISSCQTSNNVVSNRMFQKRKYTKGYHVNKKNNVKASSKIENEKELTVSKEKPNSFITKVTKNKEVEFVASNDNEVIVSNNIYASVFTPEAKSKEKKKKEECGDQIIMKSGDEVKAKIISVGTEEITYKKCSNISGPTYTIAKEDVFMVKYENGEKDVFEDQTKIKKEEKSKGGESKPIEVFSLISFITGLSGGISLLLFFGVGIIFALIAIIFGIIGLNKIKKGNDTYSVTSKVFAWIGIVLGSVLLLSLGTWFFILLSSF